MANKEDINSLIADGIAESSEWHPKQPTHGNEWKHQRFDLEEGYSFWLSAYAVRSFPNGFELPKDVDALTCGYLYRCSMMLQPKTNMLVKHYRNYDKPMNSRLLAEELGIGIRQCQRFLQDVKQRGIIKEDDHRLYMNPIYFIRSRKLTWKLYTLFQEDLDDFLPQWVVDRYNGDVNA